MRARGFLGSDDVEHMFVISAIYSPEDTTRFEINVVRECASDGCVHGMRICKKLCAASPRWVDHNS